MWCCRSVAWGSAGTRLITAFYEPCAKRFRQQLAIEQASGNAVEKEPDASYHPHLHNASEEWRGARLIRHCEADAPPQQLPAINNLSIKIIHLALFCQSAQLLFLTSTLFPLLCPYLELTESIPSSSCSLWLPCNPREMAA